MKTLDKFQGCLIGGAVGDALGYPIEFDSYDMIQEKYGDEGIKRYMYITDKALVSDDTQMSLFTAGGILTASESKKIQGLFKGYEKHIYDAYKDWYQTQCYIKETAYEHHSWLYEIPELQLRRAPGMTCTESLRKNVMGTLDNRLNNSYGCGGVMRVAPIGLFFSKEEMPIDEIFLLGGKSAATTHGGNLAIIPSCVLAYIINQVIYTDKLLEQVVIESLELAQKYFSGPELDYFIKLMYMAINLAKKDFDDNFCVTQLGQGWHGHEALAISIYCALKYNDDFEKAVVAAVNHSGDSDSTGSITGNILGAYLGIDEIPDYYLDRLELKDVILQVASDLYGNSNDLDKRYLLTK